MLRFFLPLLSSVAILSGVLTGWVRYAQHDPEYSCLSFDNITVQLDTSLYMRRFYPMAYIGIEGPDYFNSPNGSYIAHIEMELTDRKRFRPPQYYDHARTGRYWFTLDSIHKLLNP